MTSNLTNRPLKVSHDGNSLPSLIVDPFPTHLITLDRMDEIEDFLQYPGRLLRRTLRTVRNSEGYMHFRVNDPWSLDAIEAVVELACLFRIALMIRVPIIDKPEHKLERINEFHHMIEHVSEGQLKLIVAESALSKEIDGVKGENEEERAAWVADAFGNAQKVYGNSNVKFILGGTELAQATEAKHSNYDPLRDWSLIASVCKSSGVPISGILQAYSVKRMIHPPTNIVEAAKFAANYLNCEFGIIPINDETDPQSFIASRAAQTKEILQAVPSLDFLGLTTWNRKEAIPDAETYFRGCDTVIEAMRLRGGPA